MVARHPTANVLNPVLWLGCRGTEGVDPTGTGVVVHSETRQCRTTRTSTSSRTAGGPVQRLPQRASVPSFGGGPRHPTARRSPGQHRGPAAVVRTLQPSQGRPAAGMPGGQVTWVEDRGVNDADEKST